jgi:hypothetical protein
LGSFLEEPNQIKRFHRGRRFQILPAYTEDGVIHFRMYEGSTDTRIFEDFIEELLPYCGKWPEPRSVLIMDIASFHYSEKIQQLCDGAGVILRYLPPYSPDLNRSKSSSENLRHTSGKSGMSMRVSSRPIFCHSWKNVSVLWVAARQAPKAISVVLEFPWMNCQNKV